MNLQELARYCNQGGRAEAAKVELVRAKLKVLERKELKRKFRELTKTTAAMLTRESLSHL